MKCPLPKETIKQLLRISDFSIIEIRGGISKQVYKISTQTESYMLYIWLRPYDGTLTENQIDDVEYLFPDGFQYFIYNTELLSNIGVRVPKIIASGHYKESDFNFAIIECFKGISLKEYMQSDGNISIFADKIVDTMSKLSMQKRNYYGSPIETKPNNISAAQLIFNFYAEELNIASKLDSEINDLKKNILTLMQNKFSKIVETDNQEYSLVHGELTPPHIFILDDGEIGLIDIEGVKYFDVEYDWAVIDFMYSGKIPLSNNINMKKMEFYKICLKIGYMSVAVDYLMNIDSNNKFFIQLYESHIRDIKNLI